MDLPHPAHDFWSRRANAPSHHHHFTALGMPVEVAANDPDLALAARLSAGRFGQDEGRRVVPAARLTLIRRPGPAGAPPAGWPEKLSYAGLGDWITLSAGAWGFGVGRLDDWQALAVLAPALAAQTRLVSRYFVDHYILNFLFRDWAMLHASAVLDPAGQTLVALVGDHNAGKSTTALRLLRAGWRFLADGMLLIQPRAGGLAISGYPLGEVKLRDDALASFADYAGEAVRVREQRKTVVDLRAAHAGHLVDTVVRPTSLHLCFIRRGAGPRTRLAPLALEAARQAVAGQTLYWDEPERLQGNARVLEQVVGAALAHTLTLGSDPAGVIAALEALR